MKKTLLLVVFFIVLSTAICFSGTIKVGKSGSISDTVPLDIKAKIPDPTCITSNIEMPIPTNKFFNSVINAHYYDGGVSHFLPYSLNIYTYPQVFRADTEGKGLLIEYPGIIDSSNKITFKDNDYDSGADSFANAMTISISSSTDVSQEVIHFSSATIDEYSDFAAKIKWEQGDYWMTSTIVQGSPFSYHEFSDGVLPSINFSYNWEEPETSPYYYWHNGIPGYTLYDADGNSVSTGITSYGEGENIDRVLLRVHLATKDLFYGIFVPKGTIFKQAQEYIYWNKPWIRITMELPAGEKYMAVALLPSTSLDAAKTDIKEYYKYAYNFVTNTEVTKRDVDLSDYSSTTDFKFTTTNKKTDETVDETGGATLFCLFPHQYNNLNSSDKLEQIMEDKTFDTLRGTLKLAKGTGFSTKVNFKGIVPFFQFKSDDLVDIKEVLSGYLDNDFDIEVKDVSGNPYRAGKIAAKLANLIPIADNLKEYEIKRRIIIKLNGLLYNWFNYSEGEDSKYFAYDGEKWRGLLGIRDDEFYSFRYNDHHFHFGYFVYAAAILAMYDKDYKEIFKKESFIANYSDIVELLIKDFANTDKNDKRFPFMRNFDFYESHSWANGMGGEDNRGIDQESSSEAMNAWSAIYLWGLATGKIDYEKLGIYLYSNEYEAIKYYYFDIPKKILKGSYNHNSVGILDGGMLEFTTFFSNWVGHIKGIQIFPLTPAMTYLSYDKDYISQFYGEVGINEITNHPEESWYDIWSRLVALYNPTEALELFDEFQEDRDAESGSSKSFTYHFINFLDKYGTPVFDYTADIPSYIVLEKDNTTTWCAYNPSNSSKNVKFKDSRGNEGYLYVPAKSFALTQKLSDKAKEIKISVYPVPYKPNSSGRYGGEGIYFTNVTEGTNIKIFNVAGEKVFETTIDENGDFLWKAKNNAGNNIASGIYFYYIKTSDGEKVKGKLAIER